MLKRINIISLFTFLMVVCSTAFAAPYTSWSTGQPNLSSGNCVTFSSTGNWQTAACNSSQRIACKTTGGSWFISSTPVAAGYVTGFNLAYQACTDVDVDSSFSAPISSSDNTSLANAHSASGSTQAVWINRRVNTPYNNFDDLPESDGCAYTDQTGTWEIDASCNTVAAHYACSDGDNWKIAIADGSPSSQRIPVLGVDVWDQARADSRCKQAYGQGYRFSTPSSQSENKNLARAIERSRSTVKTTWIRYSSFVPWNGKAEDWFSDRQDFSVFDIIDIDKDSSKSDCAVLDYSTGQLRMEDSRCSNKEPVLCFNGSSWQFVFFPISWDLAASLCKSQHGAGYNFSAPADAYQANQVAALLATVPVKRAWVNLTDTDAEGQWQANDFTGVFFQRDPDNEGNKDCAFVGQNSNFWYPDYCQQVKHAFACTKNNAWRLARINNADSSSAAVTGFWAEGFAACKNILDGSWVFSAPQTSAQNFALAASRTAPEETMWVNYTDQYREGSWERGYNYFDWAADFGFDGNKDCAFVDTATAEYQGNPVAGSWFQDVCFNSATARKFACFNGTTWKISTASSIHWNNEGNGDACQSLGSDYKFSSPLNSFDNERLKQAMGSAGENNVWINLQDINNEGDWVANQTIDNLPPVVEFLVTPADNSYNLRQVPESSVGHIIKLRAIDPEREMNPADGGIQSISWSIDMGSKDSEVLCAANSNPCLSEISYSAPAALDQIKLVTVSATVTDIDGKVTTATFTIQVIPAITAFYNFDNRQPGEDVTGNGFDAIDTLNPVDFPPIDRSAINFQVGNEPAMQVEHIAASGKQLLGTSYTIALQMWLAPDSADESRTRQVFAKGSHTTGTPSSPAVISLAVNNDSNPDQGLIFSHGAATIQTEVTGTGVTGYSVPEQQWLNIVVSVNNSIGTMTLYVDGTKLAERTDVVPGSLPSTSGLFSVGKYLLDPANIGITGQVDNVKIYNRAVTSNQEVLDILPSPPRGQIIFSQAEYDASESTTLSGTSIAQLTLQRLEGYAGAIRVTYQTEDGTALHQSAGSGDYDAINGGQAIFCPVHDTGTFASLPCDNNDQGEVQLDVTIRNDEQGSPADYNKELKEKFAVKITNIEYRDVGDTSWSSYSKGFGYRTQSEVNVFDFTPNPYGIVSFSTSQLNCSEPAPGGEDGTESGRNYTLCSVNLLRTTGTPGLAPIEVVDVNLTISGFGIEFVENSAAAITSSTDIKVGANQSDVSTIRFNDGEDNKVIEFRVYQDILNENIERVSLAITSLVNITNASNEPAIGAPANLTVNVLNYSTGLVGFTASATAFDENASNDVTYIIPLSREFGKDETVTFVVTAIGSSTANLGNDYVFVDESDVTLVDADAGQAGFQLVVSWANDDNAIKNLRLKVKSDSVPENSERESVSPCMIDGLDVTANNNALGAPVNPATDRRCFEAEFINLSVAVQTSPANNGQVAAARQNIKVSLNDATSKGSSFSKALIKITQQSKMITGVSERKKRALEWNLFNNSGGSEFNPEADMGTAKATYTTSTFTMTSDVTVREAVLVAIDLDLGMTPNGVIWEQGNEDYATYVGIDGGEDSLVVRAGSGGNWTSASFGNPINDIVARLSIPLDGDISKNIPVIRNKAGTLYVEIEPLAGRVSAWFIERAVDPLNSNDSNADQNQIGLLGSAFAIKGFVDGRWRYGNDGALGQKTGEIALKAGGTEVDQNLTDATVHRMRIYDQSSTATAEAIALVESNSGNVDSHNSNFNINISRSNALVEHGLYLYVKGIDANIGTSRAQDILNTYCEGDAGCGTRKQFESYLDDKDNSDPLDDETLYRLPIVFPEDDGLSNGPLPQQLQYSFRVFDDNRAEAEGNAIEFKLEAMTSADQNNIDIAEVDMTEETHLVKILDADLPIFFKDKSDEFPGSIPTINTGDVEGKVQAIAPYTYSIAAEDLDWISVPSGQVRYKTLEVDTSQNGTIDFTQNISSSVSLTLTSNQYPFTFGGTNNFSTQVWSLRVIGEYLKEKRLPADSDVWVEIISPFFNVTFTPTWRQVEGTGTGGGTCINRNGDQGSCNDKWTYNPYSNQFISRENGSCLRSSSTNDGADVSSTTCSSASNQKWQLTDGDKIHSFGTGNRICRNLFGSGIVLNNGGTTCGWQFN